MKTATQRLRAVNRIPISSGALKLDRAAPLAGQVSAGFQIHHPKGNKGLASVLRFGLNKPRNARAVLTVHHGAKTKIISYPFGKSVAGNQKVKMPLAPQAEMAGVHHVSIHAYVQRKDRNTKVRINLKHLEVSQAP